METPVYPRARPVIGCSSSGSGSSDGIVFISTTGAIYGSSDDESDSDSFGSSSGSERSSFDSNRSNSNSSRTIIELERPAEPPQIPSSPPQAYRPPPPTAQARARARLGYTGANSALPNTASPWGEGTARMGIRPPDYSLASVRNNNNNATDPNIEQPSPAIVPAVVRPPPYHLHLRDRFLETDLAAAAHDPNSPNPPPPAYGVAPHTPFLVNSSARIARSAAATRSVEKIGIMIDRERGDSLRDETGTRGWRGVDKKTWCFWAFLLLFALVINGVALYYSIVHP